VNSSIIHIKKFWVRRNKKTKKEKQRARDALKKQEKSRKSNLATASKMNNGMVMVEGQRSFEVFDEALEGFSSTQGIEA
jgi:hypothetical protein